MKKLSVNFSIKYQDILDCNITLKIHFFHSHIDFFLLNFDDVRDEHEERVHQDVATI